VISAGAAEAIEKLNQIVRLDGADLRIISGSATSISLELDLSQSTCPECVVPSELMLDILRANLVEADPDIAQIELHDPRDDASYVPIAHT
jgi:hypothetical protein